MDVQKLFETPDLYLFSFHGEDALVAEMDRGAYRRSIFLDRRMMPKSPRVQRVKLAALYEQIDRARAPDLRIIFHVAHCGSTLLARALDVEDANLVYREPMTLRQLGVEAAERRDGGPPEDWVKRLRLAAALLSRRYAEAGPAIVKANVPVNFMIPELMEINREGPAILLYASLENYLLAILRSPDHRAWVERVTDELAVGLERRLGGFERGQGLAKAAAQLWLAQMLIFDETLRRFPSAVSLDAEDFFNQPSQAVAGAFTHFGQTRSEQEVEAVVASDLFSRYSKNPQQDFNNAQRLEMREQVRAELGAEIAAAKQWIVRHPAFSQLPSRLVRPLIGAGRNLVAAN